MHNPFINNFGIHTEYKARLKPEYYHDLSQPFIYQPHVYELAINLAKKSGSKYIIDIGAGNGLKLKNVNKEFSLICIDYLDNLNLLRKNLPEAKLIEANFENGVPKIDTEILNKSVVISSDVVEHIINPHNYLKSLSTIAKHAKYLLISTPDRIRSRGISDFGPPANPAHVREWSLQEFYLLLKNYGFGNMLAGYTVNTNYHKSKSTFLIIAGHEIDIKILPDVKTQAIISSFNDEDIIEEVILHYLSQGVDVHIIDNESSDQTNNIVTKIANQTSRVSLSSYKCDKTKYDWKGILQEKAKLAQNSKYQWFLHVDSDELRFSPWPNTTLSEAISFVNSLGYNCIDHTVLDFRPTKNIQNYSDLSSYCWYEFGRRPGHFLQIKGWKNEKVDISSSGGHEVNFLNNEIVRKVFPLKFLLKHYSLRGPKHAKRKIFEERLPKFNFEKKKYGWHTQYDMYKRTEDFLWEEDNLFNFNKQIFELEYLVERISSIGL